MAGYHTSQAGGSLTDAFVSKLDPTGIALIYSTCIGGTGADEAYGIAVDSTGAAYIAGSTLSTNFPVTAGSYQTTSKGNRDAFVTKLAPAGNSLVYSTYLGGSLHEYRLRDRHRQQGRRIRGGLHRNRRTSRSSTRFNRFPPEATTRLWRI